jgi:SdpI/YfhL protein family
MYAGEVVILVVFLLTSCVLVGLGIPLAMGLVRPNPLYGFRTPATLQDPGVWYPVNRVAGWWLAATGVAVGGLATCTFLARLGLPAAPLLNLAPLMVGIVGMILHGTLVARRVAERRP